MTRKSFAVFQIIALVCISAAPFSILFIAPHKADAIRTTLAKPPNNLGLIGYWSFNEGTGTQAGDFSGNRNTGTLSGSTLPGWVTGRRQRALSFDGSTSYVDVGNNPSLEFTTKVSACAWVKPNSVNKSPTSFIMGKDAKWTLEIFTDAKLYFQVTQSGGSGFPETDASSAAAFSNGVWYYVCAIADGSTLSTYVNGTSYGSSVAYDGTIDSPAGNTKIGWADATAGSQFQGAIDEVRVYNRALGASEVAKLYQSGAVKVNASSADLTTGTTLGPAGGLVGHWTFDGPDIGTTVVDRSGQGNHGYYIGSATSSVKTIGHLGQALNFNGSSNYVSIADDASLESDDGTVSLWFKSTSDTDQALFSKNSSCCGNAYFWLPAISRG